MNLQDFMEHNSKLAPVISGLVVHLCFNRLEPRRPILWFILMLGLPVALAILLASDAISFGQIAQKTSIHIITLTLSTVLYRLSPFHPLAKFPGPLLARISMLYMAYVSWGGKRHYKVPELHKKYGTHVRIGPNVVSVVDVQAIRDCLGSPGMPRDAHYRPTSNLPLDPVTSFSVTVPNHNKLHAEKRKAWNRAFVGGQGLKEFDEPINRRSKQLIRRIGEQEGVVDLGKWISYFTFDFMGDMAFGGGFEMMEDGGDSRGLWPIVIDSLSAANIMNDFEWLGSGGLLFYLPIGRDIQRLSHFSDERTTIRTRRGAVTKDLFYFLAEDGEKQEGEPAMTHKELTDDLFAAIRAGADTTASVLSNAFYSLLVDPLTMKTLRKEVDLEFGDEDASDLDRLAAMPYLNAVINETLRLYPAVPFSVARTPQLGSGGQIVAGRFLPERNTVYIPIGTLHRDPRYFFPDPDRFWPERWILDSPSIVLNRDAFIPFSYGPGNCVGKQLALREMRTVIARIVQKYDISFREGYDPANWLEDLRDDLVFVKGKLPVVLSERRMKA